MAIKVLLVDNEAQVRRGLRMRMACEPDMTVIGQAGNGFTALAAVRDLAPDVVVLDIEMPGIDGITTAGAIRRIAPGCAVVILTLYATPQNRERAAAAGVAGFVDKHDSAEAVLTAIRAACPELAGAVKRDRRVMPLLPALYRHVHPR